MNTYAALVVGTLATLHAVFPAVAVEPSKPVDSAAVVARCAEAMGGRARIDAIKTLRATVAYSDHTGAPVVHEIKRPGLLRSEGPGRYTLIFDGQRACMITINPDQGAPPSAPQIFPAEAGKDCEIDIAWLIPAFFDHPARYAGTVERGGRLHDVLVVVLPLGGTMTYQIDAKTSRIGLISTDLTYEGKTYHMEREWTDYRSEQGINYPTAMTYQGRGGQPARASIITLEVNPPLDDARFHFPDSAR
jgi:hypothetical protein